MRGGRLEEARIVNSPLMARPLVASPASRDELQHACQHVSRQPNLYLSALTRRVTVLPLTTLRSRDDMERVCSSFLTEYLLSSTAICAQLINDKMKRKHVN